MSLYPGRLAAVTGGLSLNRMLLVAVCRSATGPRRVLCTTGRGHPPAEAWQKQEDPELFGRFCYGLDTGSNRPYDLGRIAGRRAFSSTCLRRFSTLVAASENAFQRLKKLLPKIEDYQYIGPEAPRQSGATGDRKRRAPALNRALRLSVRPCLRPPCRSFIRFGARRRRQTAVRVARRDD